MKYFLRLLFTLPGCFLYGQSFSQENIRVGSPDGNIIFSCKLVNSAPVYSVAYKGNILIDASALSLEFDDGKFADHIKIRKPLLRDATEDYTLPFGKTSKVHTQYREGVLTLEETVQPFRKVDLIVRVFNDGMAIRYHFPQQAKRSTFTLLDENTTFRFTKDPIVHALLLPNYTTSHEGLYTHLPLSKITKDTLMDMPAVFECKNNIYVAITEAALLDYAGMYLSKHDDVLVSKLSPLPKQNNVKVKATLPHNSPWRVMLIGDKMNALFESNIITTLNEPCKIKDISWLKPGKTTFPWWNGNVVPDTLNAPGNNFVTAQYYIDFCARNKLEYHSVVEYGLHQWYMDDGVGFQPGPHADVTTPVPGLDMKEICDYGAKLNVGIRVWVHWAALYPKLDKAFALFEQWGLKGMMIDFMDRDDQEMVNIQNEMLQKAAQHHLHIQFHGAYKPTGINRTYPNEFTREGTLNYEADKWNPEGISPDHDLDIIFTRMLAGSTDYHLGGFRAVPPSKFKTQYTRPLMLGTRCHMLAMYAVLENYLQMVCDYPAAYEGEPGFEFIKQIPTVWDETKFIDGKPGSFIAMARRCKNDWYIGVLNNHDAKEMEVPLQFLGDGKYTADIYTDAADVDQQPDHIQIENKTVTNTDVLHLKMAGGGGTAIRIKKAG